MNPVFQSTAPGGRKFVFPAALVRPWQEPVADPGERRLRPTLRIGVTGFAATAVQFVTTPAKGPVRRWRDFFSQGYPQILWMNVSGPAGLAAPARVPGKRRRPGGSARLTGLVGIFPWRWGGSGPGRVERRRRWGPSGQAPGKVLHRRAGARLIRPFGRIGKGLSVFCHIHSSAAYSAGGFQGSSASPRPSTVRLA